MSEQEFIQFLEASLKDDDERIAAFRETLAEKRKVSTYSIFDDFPPTLSEEDPHISERAKRNLFFIGNILADLQARQAKKR